MVLRPPWTKTSSRTTCGHSDPCHLKGDLPLGLLDHWVLQDLLRELAIPLSPPTGPPVVVPRPDRPGPDGGFPPCKVQGENFCVLTNDYPSDYVGKMVERDLKKIKIMYEELQTVGDPELFPNHLGTSSAARGAFACETDAKTMRPGWAKDAISGEWMLVINTDAFPQKVRTESCRKPDEPCSFIAPFYESTCQQRYSLHRLLALHPWNPEKSPQVTLFKFPAGCSCRVDASGGASQPQSYKK
ncbi:hypothetical protein MTO96_000515 [Rhipicephalus appendiculatus]